MNAPLKHKDEAAATFVRRHIGPSPRDIDAMLETVGAKSLTALMDETLPSAIRQKAPLDLGHALQETEALAQEEERRRQRRQERESEDVVHGYGPPAGAAAPPSSPAPPSPTP